MQCMHHSRVWQTCRALGSSHAQLRRPGAVHVSTRAKPPPGLDELAVAKDVPRIKIGKGKANLFLDGNPIVFTNALDGTVGSPATGEPVVVSDHKGKAIAWGVYNADSLFKCRILQLDREVRAQPHLALDVPALLDHRIAMAVALRANLQLPRLDTNVYRLINSEGDRLSGLTVDVLNDHLVVSSSAVWVEDRRDLITNALQRATYAHNVSWRTDYAMLMADRGAALANVGLSKAAAGLFENDGSSASEDAVHEQDHIVCSENGVKLLVNPLGQKTGYYADQRDSRMYLRQLVRGKRVLDLCCYSGGFAINAALHGATEVVGVDSSREAARLAMRNAELNDVSDRCSFIVAKVEDYLKTAATSAEPLWDVIVLDPPKLAPSRKHLKAAANKYTSLNTDAMRMLKPGGLLMTCSCSGAVAQGPTGTFVDIVAAAARKVRRHVVVLRDAGAAPDHTLDPHFPHGKYMTNLLVRVNGP